MANWRIILAAMSAAAGAAPLPAQERADPEGSYEAAVAAYNSGAKKKIIGGTPAADKELPWQVSLGVSWIADPYEAHFCGGTIYAAQWIVTAGHCVSGLKAEHVTVAYGATRLTPGTRRVNVAEIIRHPDYKIVSAARYQIPTNDVALLKLRTPLKFDDNAKPIALISAADEAAFTDASRFVISGFGAQAEGGNPVPRLFRADVDRVANAVCNGGLSYNGRITPQMMCAGVKAGGTDSCQGDSGGPLVYRAADGTPRLTGVVSWGDGCARALKFGVYARIGNYGPWIVQNAR